MRSKLRQTEIQRRNLGVKRSNKIEITALIPAYNDSYCLRLCLTSIVDFFDKIIVFDDLSDDNTPELLSHFVSKYKNISYYRNTTGQQLGWIEARKFLLFKASSDLLFWLDSDDVLYEDKAYFLREIPQKYDYCRFKLLELVGDLHHTTRRTYNTVEPCHLFVNRKKISFKWGINPSPVWTTGTYPWNGNIPLKSPLFKETLFCHLKGVKPDTRLFARNKIREWMKMGKPGTLSNWLKLNDRSQQEIHSSVWGKLPEGNEAFRPLPKEIKLPQILKEEIKHERFKLIYKQGKIVDREDREWSNFK